LFHFLKGTQKYEISWKKAGKMGNIWPITALFRHTLPFEPINNVTCAKNEE
jgi:hypothetical protein